MAQKPEDLNLPNSVVAKIIKEALPDNVNISKDARLAISKAASVFVLYSSSCANNFAMQAKRKTISSQDVFEAMNEMEFEHFIEPLKQSLEAFKIAQKGKKEIEKKKNIDREMSEGQAKNMISHSATNFTNESIPEEVMVIEDDHNEQDNSEEQITEHNDYIDNSELIENDS